MLKKQGYPAAQGMKKMYFDNQKFSAADLSEKERAELFQVYGFHIEDVRNLTKSEEWFFSGQEVVSPAFYIQTLYKVQGIIEPLRFEKIVMDIVAHSPILQTNFYRTQSQRVLGVVRRGRQPMIAFHALAKRDEELERMLENIMEADRRRGFDLAHDRLLRLAVFRTGIQEYAVLVTQPQIVADAWDIRDLFQPLFSEEAAAVSLPGKRRFSFADYLEKREQQDKAPAFHYWKQLLADLPAKPELPGYQKSYQSYHQEVCRFRLNPADMAALREKGGGERNYQAVILQTAWGLMLQQLHGKQDTYFSLLMSNRSAKLENIGETAGIVNVVPVRLKCSDEMLVGELVKKQYMQMVISQPFSYCRRSELQQQLGRKESLFDHFLSFHGFMTDIRRYTEIPRQKGVVPVTLSSVDAQGMDLGVYFRYDGRSVIIECRYNERCFSQESMDELLHQYVYTLHCLLNSWTESVHGLKALLGKRVLYSPAAVPQANEKEWEGFLASMELFFGQPPYRLKELLENARVTVYLENDTILAARHQQSEMLFVMSGKVVRSRDAGDGWMNMIDIQGPGSLLNELALLESESVLSLEAASERVTILAVPLENFQRLVGQENGIGIPFAKHLLKELDKYQKRWLMS